MKVLLYLPVVTPWWFAYVVEPLLRRLATVAEVDVLAPVRWRNTGVGPDELARCRDLAAVRWHIVDSADHPSLRTAPTERDDLLAYVDALSPDVTLCRSADFATTRAFPGTVRFLMEAIATPFRAAPTFMITDQPFANGVMPDLAATDRERLDDLIDPLWTRMHDHWDRTLPDRRTVADALRVPADAPMFLLPLEYEHPENFFRQHRPDGIGHEQRLAAIAEAVAPHGTLVITDHPLNIAYVDRTALHDAVARLGKHVVLAPGDIFGTPSTLALTRHMGGMLVGDSKSFAMAAAFGVATMRRSTFASGDWLVPYADLATFVDDVRRGRPRAPGADAARLWFAYHFANEAFDPEDTALTGEEIVDRCRRPVNPDRWAAGLDRMMVALPEHVH